MRTYEDTFSGARIYPGKGKLYVRGDSKIFRFQNGKSESLFLQRKNPRRIAWTVLYRRQHRKGISEEEKRNIRPEARSAARAQAIKESKEKKQADAAAKKSEKAKLAAQASKGQAVRQVSKQGAKGSAPKVQAKSR
ncbi:putative ribosomal protein L24.e.A, cytosolic [Fusarium fujikuroi]|nr:putative ribosomal protein L24.e.A, cytosolic [Fusarium fujikuroi]